MNAAVILKNASANIGPAQMVIYALPDVFLKTHKHSVDTQTCFAVENCCCYENVLS